MVAAFDQAINPSKRLGEELKTLQLAGKSSAEIFTVYQDQIRRVGEATERLGQVLDPEVAKLYDQAKATKEAADKAALLAEEEKKQAEALQKASDAFERQLNPSRELGAQLAQLEKAGKSEADILAVMGDELLKVNAATTANRQALDPLAAKYGAVAASTKEATDKATAFAEAERKEAEATKQIVTAFEKAQNPTKELGVQIQALEKAGKSQAEIWSVMGKQITGAMETARSHGATIDATVQKMADFGKETSKTGLSFEALGKYITDFARNPVQAAKTAIVGFLEKLGPVGVGISAIGTAAAAAGAALFKFMSDAAAQAEQLQNLSAMTGLSTQQLKALQQVAKEAGMESMDLGRMISQLNKQLGDSKPNEFTNAMKMLGVSATDASGKTKDAVAVLDDMRRVLLAIPDSTDRAQLGAQVFSGRMRELLPLMLNSNESLGDMTKALIEQGIAYDDITQGSLLEFDRQLDQLGRMSEVVKVGFTEMLAELLKTEGVMSDLAKAVAFPLAAFYKLMEAVHTTSITLHEWAASLIRNVFIPIAEAWEKLPWVKSTAATDALKEILRTHLVAMRDAAEAAGGYANKLAGLDKAVQAAAKQTKQLTAEEKELSKASITAMAMAADLAVRTKAKEKADKDAAKAANEHAKEVRELEKDYWAWRAALDKTAEHFPVSFKVMEDALHHFSDAATEVAQLPLFSDWIEPKIDFSKVTAENEKFLDTMSETMVSGADAIEMNLKNAGEKGGKECKNAFLDQVSTIGTDLSKKLVDGIMKGKFSVVETIKDIGGSLLRALLETFINPFIQSFANMFKTGKFSLAGLLGGIGGVGGGTGGTGVNLGGLGGFGGLGALAGIAGMGGLTAGMLTPGPGWAKAASGVGAGMLGGAGALSAGMIPGMGMASFGTALSYMGSGAWLPGVGVGGLLGLGALTVPILGAAIVGGAYGIPKLVDWLSGKSTYEAGSAEVMRDLGIKMSEDTVKAFTDGLHLSESAAYGIRKDLLSSPKFLVEIAAPMAQASGQMDSFLRSLEAVKTSWGTFNFRNAFEAGQATGDWTALDKAFTAAFGSSDKLRQIMPDFADKLTIAGKAADDSAEGVTKLDAATQATVDGFTGMRNAIASTIPAAKSMYETFLETGVITDDLAKKILAIEGIDYSAGALAGLTGEAGTLSEALERCGGSLTDLGTDAKQTVSDTAGLNAALDNLAQTSQGIGTETAKAATSARDFGGALSAITGDFDRSKDSARDFKGALTAISGDFDRSGEASKKATKSTRDFSDTLSAITGDFDRTGTASSRATVSARNFGGALSAITGDFDRSGDSVRDFSGTLNAISGDFDRSVKSTRDAAASARDFSGTLTIVSSDFERVGKSSRALADSTAEVTEAIKKEGEAVTATSQTLRDMQRYSDLKTINEGFQGLIDHFEKTGELLPELRQAFIAFGGDLKALDDAAELPNLRNSIGMLKSFASGIEDLMPKEMTMSPVEKFLKEGIFSPELQKQLTDAGSNLWGTEGEEGIGRIIKQYADLINYSKVDWQKYTKDIKIGDRLSGVVEQAIYAMFGTEAEPFLTRARITGVTEENYRTVVGWLEKTGVQVGSQFNTLSQVVLTHVKALSTGLETQTNTITTALGAQFDAVGQNISAAFADARTKVIGDLDAIIHKLSDVGTAANGAATVIKNAFSTGTGDTVWSDTTRTGSSRGYASGTDYVPRTGTYLLHQGEAVVPADRNKRGGITVNVNISGPVMANDIERIVARGITNVYQRGGFDYMAR